MPPDRACKKPVDAVTTDIQAAQNDGIAARSPAIETGPRGSTQVSGGNQFCDRMSGAKPRNGRNDTEAPRYPQFIAIFPVPPCLGV